jgi:polyhydroxyalkanoate synthesis regulator phasin
MNIQLINAEIAKVNGQIEEIYEAADQRAAPLKDRLERLRTTVEVLKEFADEGAQPPARKSMKELIVDELGAFKGALTRLDLVGRFRAYGYEVNDQTVGSTLSNLVRDGVLTKDEANRYAIDQKKTLEDIA